MKLNNKGFAVSGILYTLLLLFLVFIISLMSMFSNRKLILDQLKNSIIEKKYKEEILNGADPVLNDNLVPVTISDNGEVKKADLYSEWYSYEHRTWANAVILENDEIKYNDGDIIPKDNIESYFVWIPRYKYQIFDLGKYNTTIQTSQTEKSNAQEIQIKFGIDTTSDSNEGECTTPLVSGESGKCIVGDYMTHPAFLAFNTNGLWVGKFKTTGTIDNITVKPGVRALHEQNLSTMFTKALEYQPLNKSHMMKNTEWGAVAYLSHSSYGINAEINANNHANYYTGYGRTSGVEQSNFMGSIGNASAYNTTIGYTASTTGNITGVYDMSGGGYEFMASYIDGQLGSSGFNWDPVTTYGEEYFDKYNSLSEEDDYYQRILGDATGEMGPFYYYNGDSYTRNHNGWYGDYANFVDSSQPWFSRGSVNAHGVVAGQFTFSNETGETSTTTGFRLVLAK